MEAITAKEFLEKLNSDTLKPATRLIGVVRKTGSDSEIVFAFKHDLTNWITIPTSIIEHIHVLRTISGDMDKLIVVKVRLKSPSEAEAKVLYDLLASLSEKVNKYMKRKWMRKVIMGEGNSCHHSCNCHSGMGCKSEHSHTCPYHKH